MNPYLRVLAALLLAGCVLDEAWQYEVVLTNRQPGISGEVFTLRASEGNTNAACVPGGETVHASFVGAGEFRFVATLEAVAEGAVVFIRVRCDLDGDGAEDEQGGTTTELRAFDPELTTPQVLILADDTLPECLPRGPELRPAPPP